MPNYDKLLFDYDTTRENVMPQLDYIGSQYLDDYHSKSMTEARSLANFEKSPERSFAWMDQELNENRFINDNLMPQNSSKYHKKTNIYLNKMLARNAPVMNSVLLDPKPTSLCYEPKYDVVQPKSKVLANFNSCIGRRSILPGQRGMHRSECTIEEASLGMQGQGYGLASYTKGQLATETVDTMKARDAYLDITQERPPMKINFAQMLGRENFDTLEKT